MPDQTTWWCICSKYCASTKTALHSRPTWYRHLREAANAGLSDNFQVTVSTSGQYNMPGTSKRPSNELDSAERASPSKHQHTQTYEHPSSPLHEPPPHKEPLLHEPPPHEPLPHEEPLLHEPPLHEEPPHEPPPHEPPPHEEPPHEPPSHGDQPQEHPKRSPLADLDLDALAASAWLDNLKRDISFIQALRNATLDDGTGLKGEKLERLCNPP
ncbi:uncharacterized protein BJ212DRAFT_1547472 [Suillus subaureus]|uniref:Uncharacterized protein n=1 Tax=Suillus subaureus TaxID=48587 RepID=A0A9P7EI06_9AGAM|nr:uncharacterized protein BJ212DRAFT_1547472 [Suillus subaureus]KAG1821879.1 hypothetical protein BJ212DRAFT_1547472 [Suillus subaureus]